MKFKNLKLGSFGFRMAAVVLSVVGAVAETEDKTAVETDTLYKFSVDIPESMSLSSGAQLSVVRSINGNVNSIDIILPSEVARESSLCCRFNPITGGMVCRSCGGGTFDTGDVGLSVLGRVSSESMIGAPSDPVNLNLYNFNTGDVSDLTIPGFSVAGDGSVIVDGN